MGKIHSGLCWLSIHPPGLSSCYISNSKSESDPSFVGPRTFFAERALVRVAAERMREEGPSDSLSDSSSRLRSLLCGRSGGSIAPQSINTVSSSTASQ